MTVAAPATVRLDALRRHVVAWQGFAARARTGTLAEVEATIGRLSCVQLDSISTVERSARITLGSRAGDHPRAAVSRLLAAGRVFEYWAHEACVLPIADYPLARARMRSLEMRGFSTRILERHGDLVEPVLARIRERGPLASRDFEGTGAAGWWDWKPAKQILEALWTRGDIAIAKRQGFQRVYDLTERVIPRQMLAEPVPDETEWLRALALRAVRARGALTLAGMVEHWRLPGGKSTLRLHAETLEHDGLLRRLRVDDGGADVYVPGDADLVDSVPRAGALLSPFDNLLWDRPFARRVLGFDHLIEVYKPAAQRRFGYYVLPFLRGDRLVGRADLKTDRREGVLRVLAFHVEPGVRRSAALDEAFERALVRLTRVVGVERAQR